MIDDDTPDPERDDPPLITGDVESKSSARHTVTGPDFDPWEDGIDFYESLEGMLTQINKAVVVEPTNLFSAGAANENTELAVLADGGKDASGRSPTAGRSSSAGSTAARRRTTAMATSTRSGSSSTTRWRATTTSASSRGRRSATASTSRSTAVVDYAFGNYKFLVRECRRSCAAS